MNRLVIKLKKQEIGQEWSALDDTADKKKADRDKRVKNGKYKDEGLIHNNVAQGDLKDASTQQLLADMYASK